MYTCVWMVGALALWTLAGLCGSQRTTTTCEKFEKGARFDPFQIVETKWRIIYFYSDTIEIRPIIFSLISNKRLDKFKTVVEALDPDLGVDWNKTTFMMEPKPGVQVVMIYMGTPGAFRGIVKVEQRDKVRPNPEPLLKLADLRFKLEDRYLGMMCCEDMTAFVLARNDEVPSSEDECEKAASLFGFQGTANMLVLVSSNDNSCGTMTVKWFTAQDLLEIYPRNVGNGQCLWLCDV